MSDNSYSKYKNAYAKEHYTRIVVNIPKADAEYIKQYAKDLGYTSTTRFIIDAIQEKITRG